LQETAIISPNKKASDAEKNQTSLARIKGETTVEPEEDEDEEGEKMTKKKKNRRYSAYRRHLTEFTRCKRQLTGKRQYQDY